MVFHAVMTFIFVRYLQPVEQHQPPVICCDGLVLAGDLQQNDRGVVQVPGCDDLIFVRYLQLDSIDYILLPSCDDLIFVGYLQQ